MGARNGSKKQICSFVPVVMLSNIAVKNVKDKNGMIIKLTANGSEKHKESENAKAAAKI
jgi:hypothetical protein